MKFRRTFLAAAVAAVGLTTALTSAFATEATKWPTRPVQVFVPAGAGGDTDFNARQMARYFEKVTGKPMVVTNVNGGGGTIGMAQVRDAKPDGNTILFAHTGIMIATEVSGLTDSSYDSFDISCIPAVDKGTVLVSGKASGLKSVADVVAKAKASPGKVIYGTEMGNFSHLQGLIFAKKTGIDLKFVDSGTVSDKIPALLGGRMDFSSISYGSVQDYGKTGDMNMIAQYSGVANPLIPGVKTFKEQGVSFDMDKPYIFAFPKGTDPAIVQKMAEIAKKITEMPEYAKALQDGFKQPVSFYDTNAAKVLLQQTRTEYMQYKDLLRQKK
ncbi:tripartite tricarboxylate transporter substrate binding protein [Rhodoferax sp.]|uniref:tripartite tricarboxylate transporter substrate binding protein n=1 Tax=Rhodoferax sp. TaxID=50421 RepID=UPI0025D0AB08|nr:tripartite tricarboxylate transporter substrate binding protein [Rhodoferax sp.]MCM2339842.1 tripartite tricarboxylate transporter substrate binding protein [Rhodoferax sp.]